ncbi:nicotinamidase-related amidase [Thermolongibacillus altinsuensis]|jgi:nicotinamidase-related amidase|uniref:Nicotinamidase-related amidase n=1 Tax=Thermolongibacillus altinsuensis TaxID=575256 RepID=A0A4V2QA90_9BACL|nr:isochorismatase family cysteine hydrolase [Thermolongibacillus altinsuensis]TCL49686.1 nicotinamidase-related amidase [Thermolongibacillus altinsuensis]GMB09595.1 isochorismatase [Thermolongibacillus altinsuensis]
MKKALIVIDYTIDFVDDHGKLTCGKPAQEIEKRICELTETFINHGDFVVMAVDFHKENDPFHPEATLYPPHNIEGTEGRKLYGKLHSIYETYKENIYWMDKTRYSAFSGTDLELQLRSRKIQEVHLVGVCTDICVLHTAIDGFYKHFDVIIHEDAVQSFNPVGHQWALEHFQNNLGFRVVRNYQ